MIDPDAIALGSDRYGITPASFDLPRHRMLWSAALALHEDGEPINLVTLRYQLEREGNLDRVGGVSFLAEIAEAAPTSAHVETDARRLRELELRRRTIRFTEEVSSRLYDGTEARDVRAALERAAEAIDAAPADVTDPVARKRRLILESLRTAKPIHVPTLEQVRAMPEFPTYPTGLRGGDLPSLCGMTSVYGPMSAAKSFFLTSATVEAARIGWDVAYLSAEMHLALVLARAEAYAQGPPPPSWELAEIGFSRSMTKKQRMTRFLRG